jgi:hypothetical protein
MQGGPWCSSCTGTRNTCTALRLCCVFQAQWLPLGAWGMQCPPRTVFCLAYLPVARYAAWSLSNAYRQTTFAVCIPCSAAQLLPFTSRRCVCAACRPAKGMHWV